MNMAESKTAGRTWLIRGFVVVLVAVLLFGTGYFVRDRSARSDIAEIRTSLETANRELQTFTTANHLLTANVWVYRAAAALDNRNFGVANGAMDEAVKALKAATLAEGDPRSPALSEAVTAAQNLNISVARNLESQRESLLALAARVTELAEQQTPQEPTVAD